MHRDQLPPEIQYAVCPTCGKPLEIVDASVRVGSGEVDKDTWKTGVQLLCPTDGDWHWLEGQSLQKA